MPKHLALLSALTASLILSGCTIPKATLSGIDLPDPRPSTDNASHAMQVASVIHTTVNCLGCKDTVLWTDEKELSDKMVFDSKQNTRSDYAAVEAYRAQLIRLKKDGKLTPDNMPKPPRVMLNPERSSSNTLGNSLMLADSFDGRWTNSSAPLGTGLALAAVGTLFSTVQDENLDYPPADYVKAVFVLPPDEKMTFDPEIKDPKRSEDVNLKINVGIYAGKQFVKMLTERAVEMGFTPVGELVVDFIGEPSPTNGAWNNIYQILENDAIGCPKYDPKDPGWMGEFGYCRVEWGPYRPIGVREAYSWKAVKETVPSVLGGDGKTERWINHFGYNQDRYYPLNITQSKLSYSDAQMFEYRFLMGLQKYLKPGQAVYVPAYKYHGVEDNRRLTPQAVLDSTGTHYFTVVVPDSRPLPASPTQQDGNSNAAEKGGGLSSWLNKITEL